MHFLKRQQFAQLIRVQITITHPP